MFCSLHIYLLQLSLALLNPERDSKLATDKEITYSTSCSVTTILSFCRAAGFCNQSWLFIATCIQKKSMFKKTRNNVVDPDLGSTQHLSFSPTRCRLSVCKFCRQGSTEVFPSASFPDPWRFQTDTDPRIRMTATVPLVTGLRVRFWILLFSSVALDASCWVRNFYINLQR